MRLGILSDSHDHELSLEEAFKRFAQHGVKRVLHAGDLCAPFMIDLLEKLAGAYAVERVDVVFGNIDDRYRTTLRATAAKRVVLHGDLMQEEIEGRRVIMQHYPEPAEVFFANGEYDLVVYGHTHRKDIREEAGRFLINPGEILGRLGRASSLILDLGEWRILAVEEWDARRM